MLMDLMFIKSPKEKNKLNFYLNDNNLYVKNSLKLRKKHMSYLKDKVNERNEQKKKFPVPKILYSTSNVNFHKRQKQIIDNLSPKNAIKDLMEVVNNFTDNLNFDDDEEEEKSEKQNQKSVTIEDKKIDLNLKMDKMSDNKVSQSQKEKDKEFFLTNKTMYNRNINNFNNSKMQYLNDLQFAKAKNTRDAITSPMKIKKINQQKRLFKTNLYFEKYGKYKFTRNGLFYPKQLGKYELPEYTGNNEEERKYFNYRKKISNPEMEYNRISNFDEKFNRDLREISNNYGDNVSRTRFTENPLLKKYMELVPIYDIYKDLKQIENRYIGSNFKFKLLPLYNKKLSRLDRIADTFYKSQSSKEGLLNLINIKSANYDNKNK
jgi:hypothetical protein